MDYTDFLRSKVRLAPVCGLPVAAGAVNPALKPHQAAIVRWMVEGGRRACFAAFGLGKSIIQLEAVRLIQAQIGGRALIVCPLGVRQEFIRDAREVLGWTEPPQFIRRLEEADPAGIYLTNYETVRDGKLDPREFTVASLDEASILRGFGGSKTFREFMRLFTGDEGPKCDGAVRRGVGTVPYRFVATATPSPNEYIELLAYADFLGIMDISQAKTRFFKRDSTKADKLTLHSHKAQEFWLWVSSWGIFVQQPSDLGFSDEGYALPPLDVRWHEVATDHHGAGTDRSGQAKMFRDAAIGVQDAASEKRLSLPTRVEKLLAIRAEDPGAHRIIWHDLEREREAIEEAIPGVTSVYGAQDLDEREEAIAGFSRGEFQELSTKPVLCGSGCNFQRHCSWAVYLGIGFKFNDFVQSIHRIQRFLQTRAVRIDIIYTEAEREIRKQLERKWTQHNQMVSQMTTIIKEFGLSQAAMAQTLTRKMGVERVEISEPSYLLANNDCVDETRRMEADSVGLVLTSIPFSSQYEYSPNYADFGHSEGNAEFFRQMDFLTPELLRVLKPGRIAAIHVKDRIVPGGMTGLGFQTVYPFHARCLEHYTRHGFAYMGMKTIVTDVVRENNQTYRLGWTEQCKDGTKMGVGMPEYLLIFRKPPTSLENSYADEPVVKEKARYTRARWQTDAHGFSRSSGNRLLKPEEVSSLSAADIFQLFRAHSLADVYDFEQDVRIGESLEIKGKLPPGFMLLQPQSWSSEVWTDITRMLTLNGAQSAKGKEMHLCLAQGSLVLTRDGYIPIEQVSPGDLVLTHQGRWRKVLAARKTGENREVVELRAQGVAALRLTPDHKVWTRRADGARAMEAATKTEPAWLEAANSVGHYLNLKLPPVEPSPLSATECWIIGRWLADGHIGTRGDYWISVGRDKLEEFEELASPHVGTRSEGTAVQIRLKGLSKNARSVLDRCGRGAAWKRVPAELLALEYKLATRLLGGYLSGDGYFVPERNRWSASSVSRSLLLGIALLAHRVYGTSASIAPSRPAGEAEIEGRVVQTLQEWVLSFDVGSSERRKKPFILSDGAWKRVRSASSVGTSDVWCLRVEEDESFTAEGCIVKNCPMQFDLADRAIEQWSMPGEIVFDPFGGLFTVAFRAILKKRFGRSCELNPAYFLDGATYCRAAAEQVAVPTLFDLDAMSEHKAA